MHRAFRASCRPGSCASAAAWLLGLAVVMGAVVTPIRTADAGGGVTAPLRSPPPGCAGISGTFTMSGPPVPFSSTEHLTLLTSTIVVSGLPGSLWDVNPTTLIHHKVPGELLITIQSPQGTVVTLSTKNPPNVLNTQYVFDGTTWDDQANPGGQVPYEFNEGLVNDSEYANGVLESPLAPEEALGAFIGEDPNGIWTLSIFQFNPGSGNQLTTWSIDLFALTSTPMYSSTTVATNGQSNAIPAPPGILTTTVDVGGMDSFLCDVDLVTFLPHAFCADLEITLQSPEGTVVTVSTSNGPGANLFDGTHWDDDADPDGQVLYFCNDGLVNDSCYVSGQAMTPLVPEEAFAAFIGDNPNGTWTLTVLDHSAPNFGSLNGWSIELRTCKCPTCPPSDHDCYTAGGVGCTDTACCLAICAVDPFCCETSWDAICVNEAVQMCPGCGNPNTGSCCTAHFTPFCDDAACCTAVCAIDPFCCVTAWDSFCRQEAETLLCPDLCPGASTCARALAKLDTADSLLGDAIVATQSLVQTPGDNGPIDAIIDELDLFQAFIDAVVAQLQGGPTDCANPNGIARAIQKLVQIETIVDSAESVLEAMKNHFLPSGFFAILQAQVLGQLADIAELVGQVEQQLTSPCPPSDHACFVAGGPGCTDVACCEAVCALDGFCCVTAWDGICVQEAQGLCGGQCPGSAQGCCYSAHPSAGCGDPECCTTVCEIDPICCAMNWSESCAAQAVELCGCRSDLDGDGLVDGADLGVLLAAWGTGDDCTDVSGDGAVDGADLGLILAAWGPCD